MSRSLHVEAELRLYVPNFTAGIASVPTSSSAPIDCAQFCALPTDQLVSFGNNPAHRAECRKAFCHKGFSAIQRYRPIPMILRPFRLGCVWSPVQIRPPRPTENIVSSMI